MAESTDPGFPASEPLVNQGLQESKIVQSGKHRQLSLKQVNEVTWKLTDGRGSLVPGSYGQWPGHHTTRAVAWLMAVGNVQWVVRYRNKSSRPMKLSGAKKYAVEMVKGIRPGEIITDPIKHLNTMAASLVGANNDWLPPVEPDLVEYIRYVETGWGGAHGG